MMFQIKMKWSFRAREVCGKNNKDQLSVLFHILVHREINCVLNLHTSIT